SVGRAGVEGVAVTRVVAEELSAMLTDVPPRNANREGFLESDRIRTLGLPQDGRLLPLAKSIELAMAEGTTTAVVRRACVDFLTATSEFYGVQPCGIRVLASRPLRVREHFATELFGDYAPESMLIRVWTRTAVRKEVTSFGTFPLEEFQQFGKTFGLLMIDIDHFKQVNDLHGHDAGDAALKVVSATLLKSVREHDLVGRWGGE